MKNERAVNIELLRITSMVMITILHCLGHGGVLESYEIGSIGYCFFWFIEALCYTAIDIFVLITGYFLTTDHGHIRVSSILNLIIEVFTYSVFGMVISVIVFHHSIDFTKLARTVLPLSTGAYWFPASYILLLIFIPLLNRIVNGLQEREFFGLLCLLAVLYSIISTIDFPARSLLSSGGDLEWFITVYLIGSYIRRYVVTSRRYMYLIVIFLGTGLCTMLSRLIIASAMLSFVGNANGSQLFYVYNSPFITIGAISLFLFFKKIEISHGKKFILTISKLTFGIYLVTDHEILREYLWKYLNLSKYSPNILATLGRVIMAICAIFIVGGLIEYIRQRLNKWIKIPQLCKWANKQYEKLIIKSGYHI